jgi:hypothetical protein
MTKKLYTVEKVLDPNEPIKEGSDDDFELDVG